MSTQTQSPPAAGLVGWLAANRGPGGIALVVAGIAVLILPVTLVAKYQWDFLPVVVTIGLLGLLLIAVGVSIKFLATGEGDVDRIRMLVLLAGGAGGLLIAAAGASLAYIWWNVLPAWLANDEREGLWKILVALVVLLTGLAVMFAGLQVARSEERTNANLRRLVFGYNAVLSGLLLLILLAVVNAYVSARFTTAVEAIDRGDTALSERAVNVAKGLTQPVRFYVIWPTDDEYVFPLRTLLGNLEEVSSQIRVTYLSPNLDTEAVRELVRKYPSKIQQNSIGVLVVRGEEKPDNATFLSDSDLYTREGGRFGESPQVKFKGEDRIVAALMTERATIYITQGNGEPDLNDSNPRSPEGLGVLRDRLVARGNTDVKSLTLSPADPKIPDDCTVLVVANPKPPIGAGLVKALRTYLVDRRGKAIVLLDVPPSNSGEKTMPATGLEGLLGEFGVEVTNERIYMAEPIPTSRGVIDQRDVLLLQLAAEQKQSGSELAKAFGSKFVLTTGVRVVRPARGAGNPSLRAEPLLTTLPQFGAWTETDMTVDPNQTLSSFERDQELARKRISAAPLPAAVVVSESAPPPMHPPTEAPPAPKPKLVVFGDSTFVGNTFAGEGLATSNFAFVASTLDWLSERPSSVGVCARSLKYYTLEPTVSGVSLIVLPGLIALVGIAGLGLGVWVVRRR